MPQPGPSLWRSLQQAVAAGQTVALATLVASRGSTPLPAGASLLLLADGSVLGAVSGGCVEADLLEAAETAIATGMPQQRHYTALDRDDPFSIGLTCGGDLSVVIEPIGPGAGAGDSGTPTNNGHATAPLPNAAVLAALAAAIEADQPALLASRLDGGGGLRLITAQESTGSLGSAPLDAAADAAASDAWQRFGPQAAAGLGRDWPARAWLQPARSDELPALVLRLHQPRAPFWIIGAIDSAAALAELAVQLGYRVTVIDARASFASERRFPMADAVVCAWPDSWLEQQTIRPDTVIAVLSHDHRFDIPVLRLALRSPAAYVGAMGSRRSDAERRALLREGGVSEADLRRLRSPIGLDLGGRSSATMALAILAEVEMLRHGGSGQPLCQGSGPIHRDGSLSPGRRD